MDPTETDIPSEDTPPSNGEWHQLPAIKAHESRNLLLLAVHQIMLRVGWIFKTESVIMPAFLDTIAGSVFPEFRGFLRGFMPVLNRFGQSIPPVFCAEKLRTMQHKKLALAGFASLMSLPFAVLSIVWFATGGVPEPWVVWLFMAVYAVFFVFNGLYHLSFGTVQGKLIRPARRGRLLMISTFWGSLPAMGLALWLLGDWLALPDRGFGYIFAFSAVCFFLSGLTALLLFEPADNHRQADSDGRGGGISGALAALRGDANLRRLTMVVMLGGSCLIIFPHYQALAREQLGLAGEHLMVWVVTQNVAVGIFSLLVGPLADAWGNRLTLRLLVFAAAIGPLLAVVLPQLPGDWGADLFWLVFIALGVTPLIMRIMVNYTLEICAPADHPRYLSTVSLCLVVPLSLSPPVGWLIDIVGFEVMFLCIAALVLAGGCMTFTLNEPRHRPADGELGPVGAGGEE